MQMALKVQLPASLWTCAHMQAAWLRWEIDSLVAQALREYLENAERHRREGQQAMQGGRPAHRKEG